MSAPEWIEALELSPRSPDLAFLRELFRAFNEKVPVESASKIVRDREVDEPSEKPRRPEIFWNDFLERGAGGTCFARVAAFDALIRKLGFSSRRLIADILAPRSHAALLVPLGGRDWLVDVGYPLPEICPLDPAEYETARGTLQLTAGAGSARLLFATGPEAGRSIVFDLRPLAEAEFEEAWRRTFVRTSLFLSSVIVRRELEGRVLRFHRGEVQILDASSRTRIPLRTGRAGKLAEIFQIDRELLACALDWTGDPEPDLESARIEVFREGEDSAPLFETIATPEGYRRFAEGLGRVEIRPSGEQAFEARIAAERGEPVVESIRVDRGSKLLTIDRSSGLRRTGFRLETTDLGARLVRFAELPDSREEFLRSDLGRGRIAAILAMDLAALSRL
jgi:arylamine N-acetyltransferase